MGEHTKQSQNVSRNWMTKEDVANELGVCTKSVDRLVDRGKLPQPARLSARMVRFDRAELAAVLEEAKRFAKGPSMAGGVS